MSTYDQQCQRVEALVQRGFSRTEAWHRVRSGEARASATRTKPAGSKRTTPTAKRPVKAKTPIADALRRGDRAAAMRELEKLTGDGAGRKIASPPARETEADRRRRAELDARMGIARTRPDRVTYDRGTHTLKFGV